jgi:hypothetical protein
MKTLAKLILLSLICVTLAFEVQLPCILCVFQYYGIHFSHCPEYECEVVREEGDWWWELRWGCGMWYYSKGRSHVVETNVWNKTDGAKVCCLYPSFQLTQCQFSLLIFHVLSEVLTAVSPLVCSVMHFGRWVPTFWKNILSPSSGWKSEDGGNRFL